MGLSSATIEENRVEFILGAVLPVELITGELNFKMALLNEIANCFIAKDGNCRKEYVSHIEEL